MPGSEVALQDAGSALGLFLLAFLFGVKHGFDADHLATVDALTRMSADSACRARSGAGFSLGHGAAVVCMALLAGLLQQQARLPPVLQAGLAALSASIMLGLGVVNLRAALSATAHEPARLTGLRSQLLLPLLAGLAGRPAAPWLVGGLFALSFDTLSLAAVFALTGAAWGGLPMTLLLAAVFTLGMLLVDGLNGWWVARMLHRSDVLARRAAWLMALAVGMVSLAIGACALGRLVWPWMGQQDGTGNVGAHMWLSLWVLGVVAGSYLLAMFLARRSRASTSTHPA